MVRKAIVIAVLTGIAAAAVWQSHHLRSRSTVSGVDSKTGVTLYPGGRGVPLPDVQGRSISGGNLALRDMRGSVLVLNVWGSWCAPCRSEAPDLAEVSRETRVRGVKFVGIDVRDNPAAGRAFERSYGIRYPSFDDQDGVVLAQFAGIIPVSAVPSTIVADREGVIRASVVGRVDATTLRGLIKDVGKAG